MAVDMVEIHGRIGTSIERQRNLLTRDASWVLQDADSRLAFRSRDDLGHGAWVAFAVEWAAPIGRNKGRIFRGVPETKELSLGGSGGTLRVGSFTSEAYLATSRSTDGLNDGGGTSLDLLYRYLAADRAKVAYRTPPIGPVALEAAALVDTAGGPQTVDLALRGALGRWDVGAGLEQVDGGDRQVAVRAAWESGPLRVSGYLQQYRASSFAVDQRIARLAGSCRLGAVELHAALGTRGRLGSFADTRGRQQLLGANFWLSRSTKVFAFWNRIEIEPSLPAAVVSVGLRQDF